MVVFLMLNQSQPETQRDAWEAGRAAVDGPGERPGGEKHVTRVRGIRSGAAATALCLALMGLVATGAQAREFSPKHAAYIGECGQDRGLALAADGETAAVGRCVYTGHGDSWVLQTELPLTRAVSNLRTGEALAADGNTLALIEGNPSLSLPLRVFVRSSEAWTGQATISAGEPSEETRYESLALSGDGNTMLVGGSSREHPHGEAWVFLRTGESWAQQGPTLFPASKKEVQEGMFGHAVSLSTDGDTALIGQLGKGKKGGAYVYVRSGETWQLRSTMRPGAGSKEYAESVALAGDGSTVLVGDPGNPKKQGGVTVYARSGESWSQQGPLLTVSGDQGLGTSLAISSDGDVALIGAPFASRGEGGSVAVFERTGEAWAKLSAIGFGVKGYEHTGAEVGLGVALSADANTALVAEINQSKGDSILVAAWEATP